MDGAAPQLDSLLRLVGLLTAIGVDYMITGPVALALYDVPRMTRDVDVVIDVHQSDKPFLGPALTPEFTPGGSLSYYATDRSR